MDLVKYKKFIEENPLGFATVGKNGKPHNIAVAFVKVIDDKIIISNAHIRQSVKNLEDNPNVSLVIWSPKWETMCVGFEIIGKAENYTSGKWLEFVKNMPENKGYKIMSAIVVKVSKIKNLAS